MVGNESKLTFPKTLFVLKILFLLLILYSCQNNNRKIDFRLFEIVPLEKTGIQFENTLIPNFKNNIFEYDYFYNGSGVAAADFNNDGLTDLFFSANQVSSKLYINKGALKFEDETLSAGITTTSWCTGVSVVDINLDGWKDIYICHAGLNQSPNQLFINLGKQPGGGVKFTEKGNKYGLDYKGFSTMAAFFDYDKDGDLDLYLLNHFHEKTNPNYPKTKILDGTAPSNDKLYKNLGNDIFTEVSKSSGITTEGFGLGIAVADINMDGWEDIYIANDFAFDDLIYINNRNGTFTEKAKKYLQHSSRFSMGCDIADFNNDLKPDIFVVDMLPDDYKRQKMMGIGINNQVFNFSLQQGYLPQYSRNTLQLNNGRSPDNEMSFSEIGQLADVYKTDWSWSALFADLDNDGWKDLFVTNGIPKDITNLDFTSYRSEEINKGGFDYNTFIKNLLDKSEYLEPVNKPDFVFKNNKDLTFSDVGGKWGITEKGSSNGAAIADLDNDGDLDIIINNLNANATIYKNNSDKLPGSNYINLKLNGYPSQGTQIKIIHNGKSQTVEHNVYRGFQSTQDDIVHFGIGMDSKIDTIEIRWTNNRYQVFCAIKCNQLLSVDYNKSHKINNKTDYSRPLFPSKTIFSEITSTSQINFTHHENSFEDFNLEPLLPYRFSRNGPYTAVGDIDGNGLDDFWVGGPASIPGKIFYQQKNKRFIIKDLPDKGFEDMGGVLFDADNDRDLDLYVVSGGSEYNPFTATYQDRLYFNDGKGNLKRSESSLPSEFSSGSCVKACDFDKDGDLDLFVGGRVVPSRYPLQPESFILQNNGKGNFIDITKNVSEIISGAGMVTDALWSDFDGDGWKDLILTGEFMPVTFFKNENGKHFVQLTTLNEPGFYFSIAEGDFDHDGDLDYIGGNLGTNSKFKASVKNPVRIYAKDLDKNNRTEVLMTYYLYGKECLVASRDNLALQYPLIKKQFNTYLSFSNADINELINNREMDETLVLEAINFKSVYIENLGKGKFASRPLPVQAQFSTVQAMIVKDFDFDNHLDVLIAGNFFSPDYMTGQYDASIGLLLKGNGKGGFKPLPLSESGVFLPGDVKSISSIKLNGVLSYIVGINSGEMKVLRANFMPKKYP